MKLPTFKYHPDPVATGSIVESENECVCCRERRGWVYEGPTYAEEEYEAEICPWCIADGSAHDKLGATFTDDVGIGGGRVPRTVPESVVEELTCRTPGFFSWQPEQWWTHCGDAAKFIGHAGHDELEELGPKAISAIRDSTSLDDGPEWAEFYAALDADGSPTAYVFECLVCGALGGHTDCD